MRSVRPEGVAHVMRVLRERLVRDAKPQEVVAPVMTQSVDSGNKAEIAEEIARQMQVVCDEELLLRKT